MKNLNWIFHEGKLQMMNGLYGVYVVVNLVYIFLLGYVPKQFIDLASTLIILSDPTMLGMVFVGAFILLEKRSGVTSAIGTTPLGARGYILGKVVSMLVISVITSLVIAITYKGLKFNIPLLILTVGISSMVFTMLGIILGVYLKSMNQYILSIALTGIVLSLPLLYYFGVSLSILKIIPTCIAANLIWGAITNVQVSIIGIIILVLWFGVLMLITDKIVEQKLFRG